MTSSLPIGTVTFLFTDIVGSTGLAQKFGTDYPKLVADHFSILRPQIVGADGVEVNTTGDGVFAAFPSAVGAISAAAGIQRGIYEETWPEGGDVRVRVGLHTGEATLVNDDYVGVDVHKAARIMAAGHGGQILTSESTRMLSGGGFEFRSLGQQLLRGLDSEVAVFQLVVSGIPSDFPPLNTASAIPNNLPTRVSSIIGRDEDVDAIAEMIERHRLITILGPGGVGKTSLAVTVGSKLVDDFVGGVTFVDLSALKETTVVIPSVANALAVEAVTVEGVSQRLGTEKTLLVLDNFEQVIGAASDIGQLLSTNENVRVLVTSQAPLRLPGEQRYSLQALKVNGSPDSPGVKLFYDRARAADPSFSADPQDVMALVARLDGLPLAIELVAARVNLLSPAEMLQRMERGNLPYTAGAGNADRQRSLGEALSWSYDLLSGVEQTVFRRLSVFASDMGLAGAEEVVGYDDGFDPLLTIGELVDRSLLIRKTGSTSRYRMMKGIRRFGYQLLSESGEYDEIKERFVAHFCSMGQEAYSGLQSDRGEWWRSRLDDELGNIRETLALLLVDKEAARGLELLGNTWRFYHSRGHLVEFELWLGRFFELPDAEMGSEGLVKGLMARAALRYWQEQPEVAVEDYRTALDQARELGVPSLVADALYGLAASLLLGDVPGEADSMMEEAKAIYTDLGDLGGVADIVAGESFSIFNQDGPVGLGAAFEKVSELYLAAGREVQATQSLYTQAAVAIAEDRLDDALDMSRQGIARGLELNDVFIQTWGLDYIATVELGMNNFDRAAWFFGAAEASKERIGGGWGAGTIGVGDTRAVLEERVGRDQTNELIERGRLIDLAEAVAVALGEVEKS